MKWKVVFIAIISSLLFACSNNSEKVSSEKTENNDISNKEKNYIQLILDNDYEQVKDMTFKSSNDIDRNYFHLASSFAEKDSFDGDRDTEDKFSLERYVNDIRYIEDTLNKVDAVPKELEQNVDNLKQWIESKKEFYSNKLTKIKIADRTLNPSTVKIGMTVDEVLTEGWGKPTKINKTTTQYGVSEQWVYSNYNYLYFDDGILTAIQN